MSEPLITHRELEREMNHRTERLMQAEERITELETERDALQAKVAHLDKLADLYPISLGNACEDRDKLKHSDRALRKENAALRKALEPFAEFGATLIGPNWMPDACPVVADPTAWTGRVCVGHFRKAVDALKPQPTPRTLAQGGRPDAAGGNDSAIAHEDIEDREQPDKWR